jgi:hypothetical protein
MAPSVNGPQADTRKLPSDHGRPAATVEASRLLLALALKIVDFPNQGANGITQLVDLIVVTAATTAAVAPPTTVVIIIVAVIEPVAPRRAQVVLRVTASIDDLVIDEVFDVITDIG